MSQSLLRVLLLASLLAATDAVYFTVQSSPRCFQLEQPKGTPIIFSYEILDEGSSVSFGLYYGLVKQDEMQIISEIFDQSNGHVNYNVDNSGYFTYCLQQTKKKSDPVRIKMVITYGYDMAYYEKLAKNEAFDGMDVSVRKLNDLLAIVLNEADYQKSKEVSFHAETENMNRGATWWPMMQVGILIATALFQVQHLKVFFKRHKLI